MAGKWKGNRAEYTITNRNAPRMATDKDIAAIAMELWVQIGNLTPVGKTGNLLRGWQVRKLRDAKYSVYNDVPYARFVEYGTNDTPAKAAMGKALAAARRRFSRGTLTR